VQTGFVLSATGVGIALAVGVAMVALCHRPVRDRAPAPLTRADRGLAG
jgi:hypothetical protein